MSFLKRILLVAVVGLSTIFVSGVQSLTHAATASAKPDKEGSGSGGSTGHGA